MTFPTARQDDDFYAPTCMQKSRALSIRNRHCSFDYGTDIYLIYEYKYTIHAEQNDVKLDPRTHMLTPINIYFFII